MPRESATEKSIRLLVEGRVLLHAVGADAVAGVVLGDTGTYEVAWSAGQWSCTCASRRRTGCSHLAAVRRIVTVDLDERERRSGDPACHDT